MNTPPYHRIPIAFLRLVARRLGFGWEKYEKDRKPGDPPLWQDSSLERYTIESLIDHTIDHLLKLKEGIYDEEDKVPGDHVGAAGANLSFLGWWAEREPGRFKGGSLTVKMIDEAVDVDDQEYRRTNSANISGRCKAIKDGNRCCWGDSHKGSHYSAISSEEW